MRHDFGLAEADALPDTSVFSTKQVLTLARFATPPGTFVDLARCTCSAPTSLATLSADGAPYDVRRFRPNVLVAARRVRSKRLPGVRLGRRPRANSARWHCASPTRPSGVWCPRGRSPGSNSTAALTRRLAERTDRFLGVYADVATPGVVRVGDACGDATRAAEPVRRTAAAAGGPPSVRCNGCSRPRSCASPAPRTEPARFTAAAPGTATGPDPRSLRMRAMVYRGPYKVRVEEKDIPPIEHPNDAIVRVELAAICGSDLHLYHGMMPDTRVGMTFGHEFIGVVDEVGPSVQNLQVGDRVMVPFNIFCGSCFFCARGLYSQLPQRQPERHRGRRHLRLLAHLRRLRRRPGRVRAGAVRRRRAERIPDWMDDEDAVLLHRRAGRPATSAPSSATSSRATWSWSSAPARSACSPPSRPGSWAPAG